MTGPEVLDVARDAIVTLLLVAAPLMMVGLIVGVAVSLFQALTQIRSHTGLRAENSCDFHRDADCAAIYGRRAALEFPADHCAHHQRLTGPRREHRRVLSAGARAAFLLVFARTGTMLMLLPGLGEQNISARLRLTIAMVLAAVLLPLHRAAYQIDTSALGPVIVMLVEEIIVGAVLGLTARLTISALEVAGSVIAQQLGLRFVTAVDPTQGEQGVLIGNFLTMLGITLFFATDMHYLVIAALNDSYTLFEPGEVPAVSDAAALVTKTVSGAFRIGIHVGAVSRLWAVVQCWTRRAVAAYAADAGLFRSPAGLDPDRPAASSARARHDDGYVPRLRRRRAARLAPHA